MGEKFIEETEVMDGETKAALSTSEKEKRVEGSGRDFLSNLPDAILHQIFSLLDTKQAVQSSLLSKRWRHLWKSLPFLKFEYNYCSQGSSGKLLSDSISQVLKLRDSSSSAIKTFGICCECSFCYLDPNKIRKFLHYYLNDAEEIDIDEVPSEDQIEKEDTSVSSEEEIVSSEEEEIVSSEEEIDDVYDNEIYYSSGEEETHENYGETGAPSKEISDYSVEESEDEDMDDYYYSSGAPRTIRDYAWISKSLTRCTLNFDIDDDDGNYFQRFHLPTQICLPSLTYLKLHTVCITNVNFLPSLFETSPLLETLVICFSYFKGEHILRISSSNLKYLKLERLMFTNLKPRISVSAPNLLSFKCRDYGYHRYYLHNLSSLQVAVMDDDLLEPEYYKEMIEKKVGWGKAILILFSNPKCSMNSLTALHNVRELKLSNFFLLAISPLYSMLKPFQHLRRLELKYSISEGCFKFVITLLKNSLNVETLVMVNAKTGNEATEEVESELSLPVELYHLKFIQFRHVSRCVSERRFLEALLQSAVNLERMTIYASKKTPATESFEKDLTEFPRASSHASLVFKDFEYYYF